MRVWRRRGSSTTPKVSIGVMQEKLHDEEMDNWKSETDQITIAYKLLRHLVFGVWRIKLVELTIYEAFIERMQQLNIALMDGQTVEFIFVCHERCISIKRDLYV